MLSGVGKLKHLVMVIDKLAVKKKRYKALISTYESRRNSLRKKLGITGSTRLHYVTDEYREKVKKINHSLKIWRHCLRRMVKNYTSRNVGVKEIEKAVVSFVGVKIKGKNGCGMRDRNVSLGKSIFYKYTLENGYKGEDMVVYLKGVHMKQAADYRKRFTNSFQTNKRNKEKWVQFKAFYESEKNMPKKVKTL